MPFAPFMLAFIFCSVNGYLQCAYLFFCGDYGTDGWQRPYIRIGSVIFCLGMTIKMHSDQELRNLRKPGEIGYKIPKEGMFNYVSGANFFGEMVEWAGFAVATWSIPGLAFSFFTCCNIGPRAWQHHKYNFDIVIYQTQFTIHYFQIIEFSSLIITVIDQCT